NGLAIGDFNGDGHLDLATADQNGNSASVLLNNGDGTFAPAVTYLPGAAVTSIVAGSLHGLPALIVGTIDGIPILPNNADGTFGPAMIIAPGDDFDTVGVGHLDGGGALDILGSDQTGLLYFLGNGDGTLQPGINLGPGVLGGYASLVTGDFDHNGLTD